MLTFFKKSTLALLAVVVLITGLASPALASTGGGTGGGSAGGSVSGGGQWRGLFDPKPGPAWNAFLQSGPWSTAGAVADAGGQGLVGLCQRSQAIWWFAQSGSNNFYDGFGGGRTLDDNANQLRGIPYVPTAWNNKAADWTDPNIRKRTEQPYIIICSAAIGLEDKPARERTETSYRSEYGNASAVFTHPYSYTTAVSKQNIQKQDAKGNWVTVDKIGTKSFENQPAQYVKTEFGKLYDSVKVGGSSGITPAELTTQVNAALEKDKNLNQGEVTLSDKNKEALAEGGVLNVDLRGLNATIDVTTTTRNVFKTVCTYKSTWNLENQNWNAETKSCASEVPHDSHNTYSSGKTQSTQQNLGFWQILSVHCNAEEFNSLVDASGATVENSGDPTRNISAVAYSKKYETRPTYLDFGDRTNPNQALSASGKLGFYDKECSYLCTSDPNGVGASGDNGANTNVAGTGATAGRSGAVVNTEGQNVNSNYFEMFRDNQAKKVTLDVKYPTTNGVVNYDGAKPVTTTVVRWAGGTPATTTSTTSGGQFKLTAVDEAGGKKTLFNGTQEPTTQKNWSIDKYSGPNATTLEGFYRSFEAQSTWASDDGKPQVLNVKWGYRPNVDTAFATKIGFSAGGGQLAENRQAVPSKIDGSCYAEYAGTQGQTDTTALFNENTGTGSTNGMDTGLLDGAGTDGQSQNFVTPVTNLVIKFVRSVNE